MTVATELADTFACFGGSCAVHVTGDPQEAESAIAQARAQLLAFHARFSRFEPASELSRLNADPRATVPVSAPMLELVAAAIDAARATGGLVDATLLGEIENAGYRGDLRSSLPLPVALRLAPPRRVARPSSTAAWTQVSVDRDAGTVTRPSGVRIDSGGVAKGLFADLVAGRLAGFESHAVDCGGDLRIGGTARVVNVASPFDGSAFCALELADVGVATSGIGRRSWLGRDGRPAHHLLDPATGEPAFTGIVQATALAPTAAAAEARSKAALLSGPARAGDWLPDGGVLVYDDGSHAIVAPARAAGA